MITALDIETIPNKALIGSLLEPEVALGNTKDPEKIRAKILEAKQEQIDKMGLSPLTGRICSCAWYNGKDEEWSTITEVSDTAEINLVTKILESLAISGVETNRILTWDGYNFDFRYIYLRAAILKIELPKNCPALNFWLKKYSRESHIDMMQELSGWGPKGTNLNTAGLMFLGRGKTERDYSTYLELIETGKGNLIGIDNLCDVKLTFDIYEMLSPYLF